MRKSKYSNCHECPLNNNQEFVIGEKNCTWSDTDIVFIAEAPAASEAIEKRPLVGKAGKLFRKFFMKYGLNKYNYVITNAVLCTNLQKDSETGKIKTFNPPAEAVDLCKINWQRIIDISAPKLIVVLGSVSMSSVLGIATGITKMRGNFYNYKGIPVFVVLHPSYIARNKNEEYLKIYDEDFKKISEYMSDVINAKKHCFSFKLPDIYYTSDFKLVDIQYLKKLKQILYIFYNKDFKKIFYRYDASENYCYITNENRRNSPKIIDISKTKLVRQKIYKDDENITVYSGDLPIELKHSVDYYYNRTEAEFYSPLDIVFFDIELYSFGKKSFPKIYDADRMINAISVRHNGEKIKVLLVESEYIQDKEYLEIIRSSNKDIYFKDMNEYVDVVLCKTEQDMLDVFCKMICEYNPEILTGWNSNNFDIPYIYFRMKRLGLDVNKLSPVGHIEYDEDNLNNMMIAGIACVDMYEVYKSLSYSREESYKLGYIAQKKLGINKIEYEGNLDNLYETNLPKFIEYNAQDTNLLYRLNVSLGQLDLWRELKITCKSTWDRSRTTTGQLDPYVVHFAKTKNKVCKNIARDEISDAKLPGAYVKSPIIGRHDGGVDFDYSSMYPSIIISFNIGPNTLIAKVPPNIGQKFSYDRESLPNRIPIIFNPWMQDSTEQHISKNEFLKFINKNSAIMTGAGVIYKGHSKEISFLSEIVDGFLSVRNGIRKSLKLDKETFRNYELGLVNLSEIELNNLKVQISQKNNKQMAYKILANALYGVLSTKSFRLFDMDLARSITLTGQELLRYTIHHVDKYMHDGELSIDKNFLNLVDSRQLDYVLYGDTDSIFVYMEQYLKDKGIFSE